MIYKLAASGRHDPRQNHLLAVLPLTDFERLLPDLELAPLPLGWAVYEASGPQGYVYFPTTSIISLLYVMEDGSSAEIAIVGNDGLVGIALFMGGESTPSRAVVQSAGYGYRLKANALKREFALGGHLQHLALRYTQALITQMAQTAVCNRHHSVEQQLCRWLLLSLDRLPSNELNMTQELIANMLGVRREGVTGAAHKLQAEGLINYSRGHIVVLDRPGLEKRVCECYAAVKTEMERLLPDITPPPKRIRNNLPLQQHSGWWPQPPSKALRFAQTSAFGPRGWHWIALELWRDTTASRRCRVAAGRDATDRLSTTTNR